MSTKTLFCLLLTGLMTLSVAHAGDKKTPPEKLMKKAASYNAKIIKKIPLYEEAAEQGYLPAQETLASIYIDKTDLTMDPIAYQIKRDLEVNGDRGFYWASKAAEQGSAIGKYYLARCYDEALGVGTSMEKSAKAWVEAFEVLDPNNATQRRLMVRSIGAFYNKSGGYGIFVHRLKSSVHRHPEMLYAADLLSYKLSREFPAVSKGEQVDDADLYTQTYFERSYRCGHPKGSEHFRLLAQRGNARAQKVLDKEKTMWSQLKEMKYQMEQMVKNGQPRAVGQNNSKFLKEVVDSFPRSDVREAVEPLKDFYLVTDMVGLDFSKKFYAGGIFASDDVNDDRKLMLKAMSICRQEKRDDYRRYYGQCMSIIQQKYEEIGHQKDRQSELLSKGLSEVVSELSANMSSSSSGGTSTSGSSTSSESSATTAKGASTSRAATVINGVEVPAIVDVVAGEHGRIHDTDKDHTDDDTYVFDDPGFGRTATYIKVYHRKYEATLVRGAIDDYYPKYNKKQVKYKTAEDAARAGWLWERKNKFSDVGMIKE